MAAARCGDADGATAVAGQQWCGSVASAGRRGIGGKRYGWGSGRPQQAQWRDGRGWPVGSCGWQRDTTAVAGWQRQGRHGGDSAGELAAGDGVELGGGGSGGGGDGVMVVQGGGDGVGRGREGGGIGPCAATAAVPPDPRLSAGFGG
nr:spidroin-1-like [Oryza sativa Japonica Group]